MSRRFTDTLISLFGGLSRTAAAPPRRGAQQIRPTTRRHGRRGRPRWCWTAERQASASPAFRRGPPVPELPLGDWLAESSECEAKEIPAFANVLSKDLGAVIAGVTNNQETLEHGHLINRERRAALLWPSVRQMVSLRSCRHRPSRFGFGGGGIRWPSAVDDVGPQYIAYPYFGDSCLWQRYGSGHRRDHAAQAPPAGQRRRMRAVFPVRRFCAPARESVTPSAQDRAGPGRRRCGLRAVALPGRSGGWERPA